MKPARALKLVAQDDRPLADMLFEFRRALSAAAGKHVGDDYRAEIMRRFDNRCHIRGDKARAIRLPANWRRPR